MIRHATQNVAAAVVSQRIASALATHLQNSARATLVMCGGSTPTQTIALLATHDLDWARITISLTDERCVPADHAERNTGMVRDLVRGTAARDALVVQPGHPDSGKQPRAAISLVGMGADGHFASLFPDSANLAQGLALDNPQRHIYTTTAASPHARISQTLAALVETDQLLLLAFGEEKRALLEAPTGLPVAALLQQTHTPVEVHWAP